ncbi:hypothetical protein EXN66_Car019835 [Channa argus]|uniref:Uncharacterized protein n=1 Tax=Channa argus TaxID=215402 RepID=A0A6G1QNU6_CHAAH|nr:hypothetical protein EXN66_Car019835 [Channa argus]
MHVWIIALNSLSNIPTTPSVTSEDEHIPLVDPIFLWVSKVHRRREETAVSSQGTKLRKGARRRQRGSKKKKKKDNKDKKEKKKKEDDTGEEVNE